MARFINYISLSHPVCINIIDCWINLFTLCTFNDSLSAIYGWRRDKVYLRYPQELGSSVRYCCFDNDILALRTIADDEDTNSLITQNFFDRPPLRVNFTNILRPSFTYKSVLRSYYVLTARVCNFFAKVNRCKSCSQNVGETDNRIPQGGRNRMWRTFTELETFVIILI